MTAVELGQEARRAAFGVFERPYLRLSDAMREANGEGPEDGTTDAAALAARRVAERSVGGIRFQRCGGGRRVIRRQRRTG